MYPHPDKRPNSIHNAWQRFRALPLPLQIIIAVVVIGFVGSAGISAAYDTITSQTGTTPTPSASPTKAPEVATKPVLKPTAVPTERPAQATSAITPTHGRPYLWGPVSDFLGKYGPSNSSQPGSASWLLSDTNILLIHFDAKGIVNYINYSGPDSWSKEQYKSFLLTFAPTDYEENTDANAAWKQQGGDPYDPIAYASPSGKFFLHISSGIGSMNTP